MIGIFMFLNKNNNKEKTSAKHSSFMEWAAQNQDYIESGLVRAGLNFINEQGEELRSSVDELILDNRWHYIDKPARKQSYRGILQKNLHGVPYLTLNYHSFRHGGYSHSFNSQEALKELWKEARAGVYKPSVLAAKKPRPEVVESASINWLARDYARWEGLSLNGISHYLKRKNLAEQNIVGLRFGKNFVAAKLIDCEGNFCGLQTIYNDGRKLFSKGLSKKGHFIVLGQEELPQKLQTIHIAEGVATAASIHLAIGETVFSALDAFNLLPAAKALKAKYPKTPIVFWADNDWQKAEKINPRGKVIGNTGLIQANSAAFKLRNALVCTPDFSILPEDKIVSATDFNDLHALCGLEIIAQTLPKKPDIKLALTHELAKYHRQMHGMVAASNFALGKKVSYQARFIKDVDFTEGVHLVRSAIGSGKTAIVETLIKNNPDKSVLFTTHLISLVESAAKRLELCSYNDCDEYDLQMERRLSICLNSLAKLTNVGSLPNYDIVIIDEIEQVLARLTSHIEQKPLVFAVLQYLMQHAKTVICLDAHLSKITVDFIRHTLPLMPVTVHFNEHTHAGNKKILLHDSGENVLMAAMQSLEADNTVYLAFNSKKNAYKSFKSLELTFPEKKGLYISSDNAGDKANKAFFADVNQESQKYDYIVCTPSVSTGVSIDNNHFDFVGGIFSANVNTANDCMQALGRVRNKDLIHVFCEKRFADKPTHPSVIAAKWSITHNHDLALMNIDADGERIIMNADYERLCLDVTIAKNLSFNDFYQQFALLALHEGIELDYDDALLDAQTKRELRTFKNACVSNEAGLVAQVELGMTPAELKALLNKPRKTMLETRGFKKQQIMEFYNVTENNSQSIAALANIDEEGRFKKRILNLELALANTDIAKQRFLAQIENHEMFAADLTHFATLQLLYQRLLQTFDLIIEGSNSLSLDVARYSSQTIIASGFLDWIEEHRAVLQGVIAIPRAQRLKLDPVRFIGGLFSRLGLKQKRVGRAEEGVYQLDVERIKLLNNIIYRRKLGIMAVGLPLDTTAIPEKKPLKPELIGKCLQKIKEFFTLAPDFAYG
jgi:phage/plasmid primase-like uncharacterized protein